MDAGAEVAALGRELGLSIELHVVLHDSNNVVVCLAPSPVVAKADSRCLPKLAGSDPTERSSGKTQAPGGIHRL